MRGLAPRRGIENIRNIDTLPHNVFFEYSALLCLIVVSRQKLVVFKDLCNGNGIGPARQLARIGNGSAGKRQ